MTKKSSYTYADEEPPAPAAEAPAVKDAIPEDISHPSVAAIVPAAGSPAGPNHDTVLVQGGEATPIPAKETIIDPDPNPLATASPDEPVKTVGQEQLERSEANEKKARNTMPPPGKTVPGVGNLNHSD